MTPDAWQALDGIDLNAALVILGGALSAVVAAVINRPDWPRGRKVAVVLATSTAAGLIVSIALGRLEGLPADAPGLAAGWLRNAAVVIAAAQVFYQLFRPQLDALEATSLYQPRHSKETPHGNR